MSLTSFLNIPEVRAKLKPLRPKQPRKIAAPLKVEPRSNRYAMVGTAFDYLLRFELQRLAPHAVTEPWVAEQVPDHIYSDPYTWWNVEVNGVRSADPERDLPELSKRTRKIVEDAKVAVADYLKLRKPKPAECANLAFHAIRLAKLDTVFRADKLDPSFEAADPEDVEDLVALLVIVPFDTLLHDKILFLNPTFGQASKLVGGADADLITGDMLVDFKTIKTGEMKAEYLDQLLGYFLLARRHRQIDPTFPEIDRLALYFCRYGYLWSVDATTWTNHPQFAEVEKWFFERAEGLHSYARKVSRA